MSDGESDFEDFAQNESKILKGKKDVEMKTRERTGTRIQRYQVQEDHGEEWRNLGLSNERRETAECTS